MGSDDMQADHELPALHLGGKAAEFMWLGQPQANPG
jgi:hypothetical protein